MVVKKKIVKHKIETLMKINQVMARLLNVNKKTGDEKYKIAYIDGCLDMYNKVKELI